MVVEEVTIHELAVQKGLWCKGGEHLAYLSVFEIVDCWLVFLAFRDFEHSILVIKNPESGLDMLSFFLFPFRCLHQMLGST